MNDLINRQAVLAVLSLDKEMLSRVLDDMYIVGADREKYSWGLELIESYIKDIEELPSAEPKRGKWVDIVELDSGGYPFRVGVCCSACGFETLSEDNYCPFCGVKMEVE